MGRGGRVLALDVGTSSVRALVTDERARPLPGALARRPVARGSSAEGGRSRGELDADALVDAVAACVDDLHAAGRLDGVEHVGVACLWHSVLGADQAGRPVSPLLTWADLRAGQADPHGGPAARAPGGGAAFHQRTGTWPHALYWTAKVPWLLARAGTRPRRFLGLGEHLTARLLDDPGASVSMASGTGLLDLERRDWDPEALELAGVTAAQLPPLAGRSWAGRLAPAYRRRWPALAAARWAPPLGDGAAANLGARADAADRAAVTIGTSAAVRVVGGGAGAPLDERLWRYRVDHDRVITGTALSGGGNLYEWARATLDLPGPDALEAALAAVPPGGGGLTVLPFHAGSRPPLEVPAGSGVLAGLSLATTPAEIVAATLEAVCFGLADGYETLAGALLRPPAVLATGGGLRASAWLRQALADALEVPVHLAAAAEASAAGAAAFALGLHRPAWPDDHEDTIRPRPGGVAALRAARARQRELGRRLGYLPTA